MTDFVQKYHYVNQWFTEYICFTINAIHIYITLKHVLNGTSQLLILEQFNLYNWWIIMIIITDNTLTGY